MKDLAESIGVSRQMISNYESGKTVPKAENILKMVSVLKFPRSFFSDKTPELNYSATYFRSQSSATKRVRDMQKERLAYAKMIYDKLSKYVNFPDVKLPELIDFPLDDITDDTIMQKALELRALWGIDGESPIGKLISIAEINGIIIVEANMSDKKLDAVSRWIVDRPFIMLTDNHESLVRRRFNISHELGHLILHNGIENIYELSTKEHKELERQANLFASHFLLPDEAFMRSLLSTSLEFFVDLKSHWKVSIQAMIYKTHQLGLLTEDQKLYLNKKISWNKWRTIEPLDNHLPIERPTLFKKVYEMILNNSVVAENILNHSFSLPIDELEKMLNVKINENFENVIELRPNLRLVKS
ncbi:MAG: XRE family transcriptional regulator [Defluviitaleaceae bacterium]|nr:XRE family transcriptional regulator [Defluviitaleaceae bacterium]